MEINENLTSQKQRYKYLAYCVVRDAIGFYLGIPQFLHENKDTTKACNYVFKCKIKTRKTPLTEKDVEALKQWSENTVSARIKELEEDFEHCIELLTTNNIWLQLLDTTPEVLIKQINSLTELERETLAIVPKWTTQDHALGRPFINDDFRLLDERADEFN